MGCIGLAARAALPIAMLLLLGAVPQQARAGACAKADLTSGCVEKRDIAPNSLRAVDIKVESQGYFALGKDASEIPVRFKPYAQLTLSPPAKGSLIITASANISAGRANDIEGSATAECHFNVGRRFATSKALARSDFTGSASKKFKPLTSVTGSFVLLLLPQEVGKSRTIFLVCRRRAGSVLNIVQPAITAVFHPVLYRSER